MIYTREDVERILDALLERLQWRMDHESFAADEYDDVEADIKKLKETLK